MWTDFSCIDIAWAGVTESAYEEAQSNMRLSLVCESMAHPFFFSQPHKSDAPKTANETAKRAVATCGGALHQALPASTSLLKKGVATWQRCFMEHGTLSRATGVYMFTQHHDVTFHKVAINHVILLGGATSVSATTRIMLFPFAPEYFAGLGKQCL